MRMQTCFWNDTTATAYYLDQGETIARHRHDVEHTTITFSGYSKTEIYYPDRIDATYMVWGSEALTLPANIDHEITALEDGTIVINMIAGNYAASPDAPARQGGVQLVDGTVVPHETA